MKPKDSASSNTDETSNRSEPLALSRRQLMQTGAAAATVFTIVPRHVLGGAGFVAPSDMITLACIGFGTQAIREIGGILASPDVRIVAVCDVEKDGVNYLEWGKNQIRDGIRRLIANPTWREGSDHVPGGRDVGKEIVETYYAKRRGSDHYKGCATYADFRELLEKEKDLTAVKVMTPDHTHATISIAALKKGMNVIVHKPLANRLLEGRAVIEAARSRKIATHFMPASEGAAQKQAVDMIKNGAIGTLREIHNWSMRPMWPQFPTLPKDTPPVPAGFDWALWLGPSLDRPYHPNYTHTNFRGWFRVWRRVARRHGPLQPLADFPAPRPRFTDQRRINTQPCLHGFGRNLRADQKRLLIPRRVHDSHEVRAQGGSGGPGHLLV